MLVIDFETRSPVDLKARGAYNYAQHVETEIICMCAKDMETGYEWTWFPDTKLPTALFLAIENTDFIVAHNAQFDRLIWVWVAVEDHSFPEVKLDRWYCSAAQCRVNNVPEKLDRASQALFGTRNKDPRGMMLIKKMSIPPYEDSPELRQEMAAYCAQDVKLTADVMNHTRKMTVREHADWVANEIINERGVEVDIELATLAQRYAGAEQADIAENLSKLTGGRVTKHTQVQRIREYVMTRVSADVTDMMVVHKKGKKKFSLDKAIRDNILSAADEQDIELKPDVYEVILCLDEGNRSSVSKFKSMLSRADQNDRVSGAFVYAGAGQTLRYASRGLQLHNMRRDCWTTDETDDLVSTMADFQDISNDEFCVMDVLARALRPSLVPADGHKFVIGDWSAIEAMVLPYLANAQDYLDMFRRGEGVYEKAAEDVGIEDRQVGKVVTLACGFGGSVGALSTMARAYGLYFTEDAKKEIVDRWRAANLWAVDFWRALERAAMDAIRHPGHTFNARLVRYTFVPDLIDGTLLAQMPGDITLQYPKARIEDVNMPWGEVRPGITAMKASLTAKADAKSWPRAKIWHGTLAENATQAFAAGVLRHAIAQTTRCCVAHVHDELVLEVPKSEAEDTRFGLEKIMNEPPPWAPGLPLKAEPVIRDRYGK